MTRALISDCKGTSAAEFALVLPLLLIMLFSIIDAGRLMWEFNQAEKATQVGVRVAVVTDVLAPGLETESYVGKVVGGVTLTQGDRIPAAALGKVTCTSSGCTCASGTCPALGSMDSNDFNLIVERMRRMNPEIQASNVQVSYEGSGLGFAGDPNGMDVAPLITVRLGDEANSNSTTLPRLKFKPITLLSLAQFNLPTFATSLTGEDLSGSASN